MSSTTESDLERPRHGMLALGYLGLALVSAVLFGWGVSTSALHTPVARWTVLAGSVVPGVLAMAAYLYTLRRAERQRLSEFEERLRESDERLRQAQKMEAVGQLAGGIAHDFNNLITVIGCSAGLLADVVGLDDSAQDDIGQIKEAADRAAALTRQLLAFSRRQMLQPRPVDLNDVVRDIEKMLRRVIGSHIAVHTTLDSRLGLILADVGQVEQVIMNLSVNARDAMPTAGALMFATANRSVRMPEPYRHGVVEPGEYVALTVRDTGQGMPAEVLEHLFEPFFTTKEQGKGTGLGLATVQGIVYQAGGHIIVESTPGVGTTFTLLFPRIRGGERIQTPPSGVRILADPASHRRSVLIVDDEDAIRDIAGRVLHQAGFRVLTAAHGEAAIEILNHERNAGDPVALVVTDVVMPVMGGRELAEIVIKNYPESRVLCISGYSKDELYRQYLVTEDITLIHKPFEIGELTDAVRGALRTSAS